MSNICKKCQIVYSDVDIDYCSISEEEYLCRFINLFRIGPVWEVVLGPCCDNDCKTNLRKMFDAIGKSIFKLRSHICRLRLEANPCTATYTIDEWAELFGLKTCPINEAITNDLVCEFYQNRGSLTCDWIKRLGQLEGHKILECKQDCSTYVDQSYVNPSCEIDFANFPETSGILIEKFNTENDRRYANYPCLSCEQSETTDNKFVKIDPCDVTRNLGGCCNISTCSTTGFSTPTARTEILCNPFELTLLIEGKNPCETSDQFDDVFDDQKNNFKLCLLEKQLPMHIKIKYDFSIKC